MLTRVTAPSPTLAIEFKRFSSPIERCTDLARPFTTKVSAPLVNHETDKYKVQAKRRNLVVVLHDVNGQEVERQSHTTNEYGSFNGTFTAPRDRLTGAMTITTSDPSEAARRCMSRSTSDRSLRSS